MSSTLETPRGLDELTAEDQALMRAMMDDGPESAPAASDPEPESEEITIEIPESAPAPRAVEEPDLDDDGVPVRRRTVNQRIKDLTDARKAAEKEAADARAEKLASDQALATEKAVTQERLKLLLAAASAPATAAAETSPVAIAEESLPDKNTDPIGYFEKLTERLQKQNETTAAIARGAQEALAQQQRIQEFRQWGETQELAFEAQEPFYRAAMDFYKRSYNEELAEIGVSDPVERNKIIGNTVNTIATNSRRDGINFASRLYNAAIKRGFQKTPAAPVTTEAAQLAPDPAPDIPAATERARRVEEGRDASTTLSGVGASPPTRLTPEKIAALSDKEFETLYEKVKGNPAMMLQIFGS